MTEQYATCKDLLYTQKIRSTNLCSLDVCQWGFRRDLSVLPDTCLQVDFDVIVYILYFHQLFVFCLPDRPRHHTVFLSPKSYFHNRQGNYVVWKIYPSLGYTEILKKVVCCMEGLLCDVFGQLENWRSKRQMLRRCRWQSASRLMSAEQQLLVVMILLLTDFHKQHS